MAQADQYSGLNRRYLQVQDLRLLRGAVFAARRPVEGLYAGRHASRMRGQSVEFSDYRQYMPGDEITDIDWKVFARSDKLFIKLFEHQADMTVNLLVDGSASMAFRGVEAPPETSLTAGPATSWIRGLKLATAKLTAERERPKAHPSKYDQACHLAAAIAFLITQQQDRVAIGFAQDGLKTALPPGGSVGHLIQVLQAMETVRPGGPANLPAAIRDMAGGSRRRAVLIVISDFYENREEIARAVSIWLHRGGEVIFFQILHTDELKLPDVGTGVFIDSESDARVRLSAKDIRAAYEIKLAEFLDGWTATCRQRGIDYNRVSTTDSYVHALRRYLFSRAAMI